MLKGLYLFLGRAFFSYLCNMITIICIVCWIIANIRLWYIIIVTTIKKDKTNRNACIKAIIPTLLFGGIFWVVYIVSRLLKRYNG